MANPVPIEHSRAARSIARRQHLLDTARNLFIEKGFHLTGMAQIATASGIAVGQIYRDFANKEAIIAAIVEHDLVIWLEEDNLKAAIEHNDTKAISDWIERIGTGIPSYRDRRLMCEFLAEIGRNPIIAEINRKFDERMRVNMEAALSSLAPNATPQARCTITSFILSIAWGMMAHMELVQSIDQTELRRYVVTLLEREITAMNAQLPTISPHIAETH